MYSTQNDSKSASCGSTGREVIYQSVLITLGCIISILNLTEIFMIAKLKEKKIYEITLLSLSVSDCMFGLSNVIVSSIVLSNLCRFEELSESSYVLYLVFVLASIFHLIFMAIDRVILVVKPLHHKIIFTKKRACVAIATIWTITLIISISLFVRYELIEATKKEVFLKTSITKVNSTGLTTAVSKLYINQTTNDDRTTTKLKRVAERKVKNRAKFQSDMQILLSVCIAVADILMIISYSVVVLVIDIRKKKVNSTSERKSRLPIICLSIGATFVLCTLPFAVSKFTLGEVTFWGDMVLLLNSGMNSVIYYFRTRIEQHRPKNRGQDVQLNEVNKYRTETTVTNNKVA